MPRIPLVRYLAHESDERAARAAALAEAPPEELIAALVAWRGFAPGSYVSLTTEDGWCRHSSAEAARLRVLANEHVERAAAEWEGRAVHPGSWGLLLQRAAGPLEALELVTIPVWAPKPEGGS